MFIDFQVQLELGQRRTPAWAAMHANEQRQENTASEEPKKIL